MKLNCTDTCDCKLKNNSTTTQCHGYCTSRCLNNETIRLAVHLWTGIFDKEGFLTEHNKQCTTYILPEYEESRYNTEKLQTFFEDFVKDIYGVQLISGTHTQCHKYGGFVHDPIFQPTHW